MVGDEHTMLILLSVYPGTFTRYILVNFKYPLINYDIPEVFENNWSRGALYDTVSKQIHTALII